MTKEQFYKNCFTPEGREKNEKELININSLKTYYINNNFNINDFTQWNQIVYMPKYGNVNNSEYNDDELNYGEIKPQHNWEIFSMWDITQSLIFIYEHIYHKHLNISDYINKSISLFKLLDGHQLDDLIQASGI